MLGAGQALLLSGCAVSPSPGLPEGCTCPPHGSTVGRSSCRAVPGSPHGARVVSREVTYAQGLNIFACSAGRGKKLSGEIVPALQRTAIPCTVKPSLEHLVFLG